MSNQYLLNVYNREELKFVRGSGPYLYDDMDNKYLDFAAGIATVSLGHSHPHLVKVLKVQSENLWHCSNRFSIPEQQRLAERLVELTFADQVFFCSSGLEANEAAIKLIRRYHYIKCNTKKNTIITIKGGFHGRSMATISAGGNNLAREGYSPLLPGFRNVSRNNILELKNIVNDSTAAILIELIQSEGGIYSLESDYLKAIQEIVEQHNILLALDEVQTGYGRIGSLFYHQKLGIKPDLLTCAKGMGGGFPVAACLVNKKIGEVMTPGTHGSTYGGNPLAMAVGNAVLDIMIEENFFTSMLKVADYLQHCLKKLQKDFPSLIQEIRSYGLLIGVEFFPHIAIKEVVKHCLLNSLLVTTTSNRNTVRLTPPLIINNNHVDEFIEKFTAVLFSIKR